jgi:uncharacterized protein YnzC (UPF0291/DUF896 family)
MYAMKTRMWSLGFVMLGAGVVGATVGSPYEQTLKQALQGIDKIATTLETIKDEDSAAAARPDLKKAAESYLEAKTKAEKVQPPEKEEKARLEKLYRPRFEDAMKKMFTQVQRVETIPGGKDALKEIAAVLPKDKKK